MTPKLRELVNRGLKQVNELGGMYSVENPTDVVVLKYTTQVVSGSLERLLLEVKLPNGSKLIKLVLWDEPWTGRNHELTEACVYMSASPNIYPSQCKTVTECERLLANHGECREVNQ